MAEANPPRSVPGADNKSTADASHPEDRKVARGVYLSPKIRRRLLILARRFGAAGWRIFPLALLEQL